MIDKVGETVDESDFAAEAPGNAMDAVINSAVEVIPIYDRIGYASATEPIEVPVIDRNGYDPIAQGV